MCHCFNVSYFGAPQPAVGVLHPWHPWLFLLMAPSVHEETVEPSNDILGILIVNQWESPYIGLKNWMTRDHLPVLILNIRKTIINGNSRILKMEVP